MTCRVADPGFRPPLDAPRSAHNHRHSHDYPRPTPLCRESAARQAPHRIVGRKEWRAIGPFERERDPEPIVIVVALQNARERPHVTELRSQRAVDGRVGLPEWLHEGFRVIRDNTGFLARIDLDYGDRV